MTPSCTSTSHLVYSGAESTSTDYFCYVTGATHHPLSNKTNSCWKGSFVIHRSKYAHTYARAHRRTSIRTYVHAYASTCSQMTPNQLHVSVLYFISCSFIYSAWIFYHTLPAVQMRTFCANANIISWFKYLWYSHIPSPVLRHQVGKIFIIFPSVANCSKSW